MVYSITPFIKPVCDEHGFNIRWRSIHFLIDWLIDWLSLWHMAWLIDQLIDWLLGCVVWFVGWLLGCLLAWLMDGLIDYLFYWSRSALPPRRNLSLVSTTLKPTAWMRSIPWSRQHVSWMKEVQIMPSYVSVVTTKRSNKINNFLAVQSAPYHGLGDEIPSNQLPWNTTGLVWKEGKVVARDSSHNQGHPHCRNRGTNHVWID